MEYMGLKVEVIAQILIGLGVLWGIYQKMNKVETQLAAKVIERISAAQAERENPAPVHVKQPLTVEHADPFIKRSEHAADHGHMERRVSALEMRASAIERKMQSDKEEIIKAGEDRVDGLNKRLDDLKSEIANAPAKTVAMLRNAKEVLGA